MSGFRGPRQRPATAGDALDAAVSERWLDPLDAAAIKAQALRTTPAL